MSMMNDPWSDPVNTGVWIVLALYMAVIALSYTSKAWPLW
jgi:hypothetical protein